jgi:GTP-binding protein
MDNSFKEETLEKARWLFAQEATFVRGCHKLADLPPFEFPEVAFAGRSNVGKSSLVNALVNRKMLARTSNTPGRTQEINFFNLAKTLYLVDLPGYGYAKVSKYKKIAWNRFMLDYLKGRPTLKRVYVLIDSRHGFQKADLSFMEVLDDSAVSYQIVLTKVDKISSQNVTKMKEDVEETLKKHPAAYPKLIETSSHDGIGVAELRAFIFQDIQGLPL